MPEIQFTPYINNDFSPVLPNFSWPDIVKGGNKPKETNTPAEEVTIAPLPSLVEEEVVKPITKPSEESISINNSERSTRYKSSERNKFISDMTEAYKKALTSRGINPEYARYLAIQDALESNFGKSYAGNWNFGNITVGKNKASYTEGKDHDENGKEITHKFRNYSSLDDFINNKIDLLSGKRYHAFEGDISQFYDRVKAGGYAVSPTYVQKLQRLYSQQSFKSGGELQEARLVERMPKPYKRSYNLSENIFKMLQ